MQAPQVQEARHAEVATETGNVEPAHGVADGTVDLVPQGQQGEAGGTFGRPDLRDQQVQGGIEQSERARLTIKTAARVPRKRVEHVDTGEQTIEAVPGREPVIERLQRRPRLLRKNGQRATRLPIVAHRVLHLGEIVARDPTGAAVRDLHEIDLRSGLQHAHAVARLKIAKLFPVRLFQNRRRLYDRHLEPFAGRA